MIKHVFGGPYAGKTTLVKLLRDSGFNVLEFDEELERAGIDPQGWRQTNPNHEKWQKEYDGIRDNMLKVARGDDATVIVTFWPYRELEKDEQIALVPDGSELVTRAEQFSATGGQDAAFDRTTAAAAYGTNVERSPDEWVNIKQFTNADEAAAFINQQAKDGTSPKKDIMEKESSASLLDVKEGEKVPHDDKENEDSIRRSEATKEEALAWLFKKKDAKGENTESPTASKAEKEAAKEE
jgi:hypothetical protein